MHLNVLCIGDIVGRPGRRILAEKLREVVEEHSVDCVIANAENAAGGSGLTPQIYEKLVRYGVHLVTLGDHVYKKRGIIGVLENAGNIVRPANLSESAAGKTWAVVETCKGPRIAVAAFLGRIFMKPADCPYAAADRLIPRLQQNAELVFVDFHAEATSEKLAMGYHLDGRVACCFGTHTHVATADERVLPGGTAYITDVGMTGAHDSILGRKSDVVLKSFRTQMPFPFELATGDVRIDAVLVTVDSGTNRAISIRRLEVREDRLDEVTYDSDDGRPEYMNDFS